MVLMVFSFEVTPLSEVDLTRKFEEARTALSQEEIALDGDISRGTLEGRIKGSYSAAGGIISFTITEKPWFWPEETIKSIIQEFFS